MAAHAISMPKSAAVLKLTLRNRYPGLRVLAWDGPLLYASRGYALLYADFSQSNPEWNEVAACQPTWWRRLTAKARLSARLLRDGFHALAALPAGNLICAVPGEIVTLAPGDTEFRVTHALLRGT